MSKEAQLEQLKTQLSTADFFEAMEIKDKIFDLEVELGIREPRSFNTDDPIECIGCGS